MEWRCVSYISKNISNIRKSRGMTQQQLADLLFVSHKTVSSWEKGRTEPDIDDLKRLSSIFQISVDQLLEAPTKEILHFSKNALIQNVINNEDLLFQIEKSILCSNELSIYAVKEAMKEAAKHLDEHPDRMNFLSWFLSFLLPICNRLSQDKVLAHDYERNASMQFLEMPEPFHEAIVTCFSTDKQPIKTARISVLLIFVLCVSLFTAFMLVNKTDFLSVNSSELISENHSYIFNTTHESKKKMKPHKEKPDIEQCTFHELPLILKNNYPAFPKEYIAASENYPMRSSSNDDRFLLFRKKYRSNNNLSIIFLSAQNETDDFARMTEGLTVSEIGEQQIYFAKNTDQQKNLIALYQKGGVQFMIEGKKIEEETFYQLLSYVIKENVD